MEYRVWRADSPDIYCTLEDLEGVDESHELKRGVSRATDFPEQAFFRMKRESPKAKKLADNIDNLDGMVVVSKALKEFLESKAPAMTEFLPVSIRDHKENVASDGYFIVNPYSVQDCIDREASEDLLWNPIDPDLICGCSRLVLDESKIDGSLVLFRPKYLPTIVLISEDLAEEIESEGFTGPYFFPCDEFMV